MVLQNETDYTESSSGHDPPGSGSCFNGGSGLAQERRMEREEASGVLTRLAGLLLQWRQSAVTVTQIPSPLVRADQKPG